MDVVWRVVLCVLALLVYFFGVAWFIYQNMLWVQEQKRLDAMNKTTEQP